MAGCHHTGWADEPKWKELMHPKGTRNLASSHIQLPAISLSAIFIASFNSSARYIILKRNSSSEDICSKATLPVTTSSGPVDDNVLAFVYFRFSKEEGVSLFYRRARYNLRLFEDNQDVSEYCCAVPLGASA